MHRSTPPLREPQPAAARASWTANPVVSRLAKGVVIAAAGGLFMATVGAFGSGEAPAVQRFPYWVAVMVSGGLIGGLVAEVYLVKGWLERRPWLEWLAMAATMTAPLTVVVWTITALVFGDPWRVERLLLFLPAVGLVSLVMTGLNRMANREPAQTHAPAPSSAGEIAPPVRFLERLPFKLQSAELYAVEAQDHYLQLHTSRGGELILLRLADAVAELEGIEGAQTHRSWWVAKDAVVSAARSDGRAVLTLKNGAEAPVSRTYAKALREAGWF